LSSVPFPYREQCDDNTPQRHYSVGGGGGGGREVLMELLRSWQLSRKKREGGLYWPDPQQLPVHRSQWKFIFLIGHTSFRIRLDSMLKLIRNYITPNGFAVRDRKFCQSFAQVADKLTYYLLNIFIPDFFCISNTVNFYCPQPITFARLLCKLFRYVLATKF
jgi:hypothetical protein